MKRYIVLFMTIVALMGALAVPASAAETESTFIDLLDYGTINGAGSHFITLNSSKQEFYYSFPNYSAPYYVDILFSATGAVPSSISVKVTQTYGLTLVSLGDNLFRAYGKVASSSSTMTIITDVSGTCWLQMLSFKVSLIKANFFDMNGFLDIKTFDGNDHVIYYTPGGNNFVTWDSTYDVVANDVILRLYTEEWVKYDYLDYQIAFYGSEVQTISAYFNSEILPFESSLIEAYSTDGEKYYHITVRVNVSELDRTNTVDLPIVHLECTAGSYETTSVGVRYMGGGVLYEDSFLTYWFNKITSGIQGIIDAVSDKSGSDDLQSSVDQAGSELDDLGASLDSVTRPAIDGINTDLSGIVSQVDINTSTSLLTNVMSNNYIGQIISMVAVLATAGYVLYGKR